MHLEDVLLFVYNPLDLNGLKYIKTLLLTAQTICMNILTAIVCNTIDKIKVYLRELQLEFFALTRLDSYFHKINIFI